MRLCSCPAATAIATIAQVTCPVSFGQLQKVAFTRLMNGSTRNSFAAADIVDLSKWQTKLAAADSTKIQVSPYLYSPSDSGGDARTTSGGNDDLGGIPEVLGGNSVQTTAQFRSCPQDIIAAIKELECEAAVRNLGVFLFDENGNIEAIKEVTGNVGSEVTTYYPIPIVAFFVGDKIHGNFDAKDSNAVQWSYLPGYSDNLAIIGKPASWNPLTDLLPASL